MTGTADSAPERGICTPRSYAEDPYAGTPVALVDPAPPWEYSAGLRKPHHSEFSLIAKHGKG